MSMRLLNKRTPFSNTYSAVNPATGKVAASASDTEILGSHGMQAYQYGALLEMIAAGKLQPEKLIGKIISLEESLQELANMDSYQETGVTVINEF